MDVGDKIGSYLITEVMSGGMSELYKVIVADAPTRYVLKRCKEDADEESLKLFRREIRILKSLQHKYIAFDFALTDSGWVLIEGNWGQFISQYATKVGLKTEFENLMHS